MWKKLLYIYINIVIKNTIFMLFYRKMFYRIEKVIKKLFF